MSRKVTLSLSALLLAVLGLWFGPDALRAPASDPAPGAATKPAAPAAVDARVGFTSERALDEHWRKHGREFGDVTRAQYLRLAQLLRDAPLGGPVREKRRSDGVITRFDTRSGAFVAFHQDRTIRTFFAPNDGLQYFERQAERDG